MCLRDLFFQFAAYYGPHTNGAFPIGFSFCQTSWLHTGVVGSMLDGLEEVLAARVGLAPAPLIPIPNFTPEWASWRSHSRFQSKGMVPTGVGLLKLSIDVLLVGLVGHLRPWSDDFCSALDLESVLRAPKVPSGEWVWRWIGRS